MSFSLPNVGVHPSPRLAAIGCDALFDFVLFSALLYCFGQVYNGTALSLQVEHAAGEIRLASSVEVDFSEREVYAWRKYGPKRLVQNKTRKVQRCRFCVGVNFSPSSDTDPKTDLVDQKKHRYGHKND